MLSFSSWHHSMKLWKAIAERRAQRELTKTAKLLLQKPAKKRRPPDVTKLLHFHAASMESLEDFSHFRAFGSLQKKQLQHFYKHVCLKVLKRGTAVFTQGTAGLQYFILLKGTVKVFEASKKRVSEIFNAVGSSVLTEPPPSHVDLLNGFLGKPTYEIQMPEDAAGVGFGGFQMASGLRSESWRCSGAVSSNDAEIIVVDVATYRNLLATDHKAKYVLAQRIANLSSMSFFKSSLSQQQINHLAEDFANNLYISKATIVGVGDAFTKVIVVASGEVNIIAVVEDPQCPGRMLEVFVATIGRGGLIGDIELMNGKSIFTTKVVAATAEVETYEISKDNFTKHIANNHAQDIRNSCASSVAKKNAFRSRRVAEEMMKFASNVRKMREERRALDKWSGGIYEKVSAGGGGRKSLEDRGSFSITHVSPPPTRTVKHTHTVAATIITAMPCCRLSTSRENGSETTFDS